MWWGDTVVTQTPTACKHEHRSFDVEGGLGEWTVRRGRSIVLDSYDKRACLKCLTPGSVGPCSCHRHCTPLSRPQGECLILKRPEARQQSSGHFLFCLKAHRGPCRPSRIWSFYRLLPRAVPGPHSGRGLSPFASHHPSWPSTQPQDATPSLALGFCRPQSSGED